MKHKVLKVIILLLIIIPFSTSLISADVGNTFGGGSSGGSSGGYSGGGYSGGGYSSYGSGYSDYGSNYSSDRTSDLFQVFWIICVIIYMFLQANKVLMKNTDGEESLFTLIFGKKSGFDNSYVNEVSCIEKIKKIDPSFYPDDFKEDVKKMFLVLQNAWQTKKWEEIRVFESNSLYNMHKKQLDEYIDNHKTNYLVNQTIKSVELAELTSDGNSDVLTVKLKASLIDYVSDDKSGLLLSGSKGQLNNRTYRLIFIRKKGVQTQNGQRLIEKECPNCGAPIKVNESGVCEYCNSVITNGDYNWVLDKYLEW